MAARLAQHDWSIAGVGNFRGVVPSTTVYYPPGQGDWAEELARDVGTSRLRPAFSTLSSTSLTVILTSSYEE